MLIVGMMYTCARWSTWIVHGAVRLELDTLYMLCLALSQKASRDGMVQCLYFTNGTEYVVDNQRHRLTEGVLFSAPRGALGPPGNPHNSIDKPISYIDHRIQFHPDGTIQPGTIYLSNTEHTAGYALTVSVGVFSHLHRYQYNTAGTWVLLS